MENKHQQFHWRRWRKTLFYFKCQAAIQKRAAEARQNAGRGDRGVGTLSAIFLLAMASAMIGTTIRLHLKIAKKQHQLMQDFAYEWNK